MNSTLLPPSTLSKNAAVSIAPPPLPPSANESGTTRWMLARKALTALLVALVFLCLAEGVARVAAILLKPAQSHYRMFDLKYNIAREKPASTDNQLILFLGDSLMTFAINPEVLDSTLYKYGIRSESRNLGVLSNEPTQSLHLLQAAVNKGHKPDYVVFNVSTRILDRSYHLKNDIPVEERSYARQYQYRCQINKKQNYSLFSQCWWEKRFYLLRFRSAFKSNLEKLPGWLLQPDAHITEKYPLYYPENEISIKGWIPNYSTPNTRDVDSLFNQRYQRYLKGTEPLPKDIKPFQWEPAQVYGLAEYCREQNIPLIFVLLPDAPYPEPYYLIRKTTRADFIQQVKSLSKQLGVHFVELYPKTIETTDFSDDVHLNAKGAMHATEALAAELAPLIQRKQVAQ